VQLSGIFINNPARNIFFFAPKIMVASFVVASGSTSASTIANFYCCFAINAQAFDSLTVSLPIFGLDIVENRVCFWDFFLGLALTTGFKR
jgi:hypothetical protein